ncbi:lipopolysaccharide biosynthesis protein [Bacillus sp. X1(2014)]|uniref:lipopolysaccharide biosynthesis protein n=1 Tax=Bacillus sp. X1(2014) TaxID=1565991 RepID=UPI0011AB142B|nr:transporter [Bacillus sp. X1(2014)]
MNSRTSKSMRNITFGVLNQVIIMILGFVSRVIFLKFLNENYLGVNSLFTEILSILSLADLGMSTVMVYSFFEPLAKHDENKIRSLLTFYKKIYNVIAAVVAGIGIALLPFLHLIVNLESDIKFLYGYYLLFLLKTVLSYLFVYKVSILNADQNNYIVSRIASSVKIGTTIAQIIVLYITKSYLLYLILDVASTWVNNVWCAKKADKLYPFIKVKSDLSEKEKKSIVDNIKSGFLYKFSSVLLNSTDNTIISMLLGTVVVGYFSNYGLVISRLSVFINTIFASLNGSIGNLIATEQQDKRYEIFSILQVFSFFLSSVSGICVYMMMNDFVFLWIGEKYILNKDVLIACMLNFYLSVVLQPLWSYRDATGLYRKTKYVMLCTAIINIVLSILLGSYIGLSGVIFASVISRLITYFWYEPILLFKNYFGISSARYFFKHAYNIILVMCILLFESLNVGKIASNNWGQFFLKAAAILFVTVVIFLLANCWQKDFKRTVSFVIKKVRCSK